MISDEAFEKAVTATQGKPAEAPATPAPVAEATAPKIEAETKPVETPSVKPDEKPTEWDGDVNKLPPELQPWAKNIQRTFTKKAMAESEIRRLGQEFQELQKSSDWQAFQAAKSRGPAAQPQPTSTQPQQAGITQHEWEEAQLDPTGTKFNALVNRTVQQQIAQAAQMYGQELQQLRTTQQVTQFQQVLSDFADVNPDAVDLHNKGILKPLLEEEMKGGKHKSYESAVAAAYERAKAVKDAIYADALQTAQGRVMEKKSAVVSTGTSTGEATVAYVDKGNTFDEAFNFAIQGKKIKVKAKQ